MYQIHCLNHNSSQGTDPLGPQYALTQTLQEAQ